MLQRRRHAVPAPPPTGLRPATPANPQLLAAGVVQAARLQRRKAYAPALGVDQRGRRRRQFQLQAVARQAPALAQRTDARVARQVATGEDQRHRRRQGEVGLRRQQLGPQDRVDRLTHARRAGRRLVGHAHRRAADEYVWRAGDDHGLDHFVANMGYGKTCGLRHLDPPWFSS